jgi:hypothetical protein
MANNIELKNDKLTRRSFLSFFSTFLVLAPVLFSVKNLFAAKNAATPPPPGPKPVEETHPLAKAFGYKKDASTVDATKFPNYKAGNNCTNCLQYSKINEGWGKCKIIAAGPVTAGGWCKNWVKKPS